MAQGTTARTSANAASVGVKVAMDDAIEILSPDDVPLQQRLASEPVNNIKNQWMHDALDPQTVTVAETANSGDTAFLVADATGVRVGDVYKFRTTAATAGTAMVKVLTVNYGTGALTVTRPFAGSTDQNFVLNDVLELVGQDLTEGADPQDPRWLDTTSDYNLTQIFQEAIQATRTARKNEQYGISDPYAYELEKKFKELAIRFERTIIHGRRNQSGSTRQMGGLFYFITSNLESNTKANMVSETTDMLQFAYDQGATPRTLLTSPAVKRAFNEVAPASVTINEDRSDNGLGRTKTYLDTDFGRVEFVMDRHVPRTKAFLLQEEYIKILNFDDWFHEMLAKTGDTDKGEIVAEKSLKVKNYLAHGILTVTDA